MYRTSSKVEIVTAEVGGEVEQHAGAAGAAVQQPFEVMRVLDVTGCVGVARVEERLQRSNLT